MGLAHYSELGLDARVVALKTREDAFRSEIVSAIDDASMVFFSGGNPAYLSRTLDATPAFDAITRGVADGLVFAGCSAGTMVAGARVTRRGGPGFRSSGLGLVAETRFGVHWNRVPSLPGVKRFMTAGLEPTDTFIGIDEMTAIAGDGSDWLVFGTGRVEVRHRGDRLFYRAGDQFSVESV